MNSRVIPVVCAAIVDGDRVFAVQRGPGKLLEGMWEFPGGKVERGETPEAALAREINEELRCTVAVHRIITTTTHDYHFGTIVLTSYWATLTDGRPQLTEHSNARWMKSTELDDVNWAPADLPAVEMIRNELVSTTLQ